MSLKTHDFVESNLPAENFSRIPLVPIVIQFDNGKQEFLTGLIDSGSDKSFIGVYYAVMIRGTIIDMATIAGITSPIETKPVIEIQISTEAMAKKWITLKVVVTDIQHPNHNLILGRDFMKLFKQITFDFENEKTILNY